MNRVDIFRLSDDELWRGLKDFAARERVLAADAVAYVAETKRRKLHESHGWRSMFDYCVQSLRWSEATAFRRTRAARAVLEYPVVLEMLYDGRLHIEGIVILYAFLEDEDFPTLLLKAVGKTAKEIEWLVAERRVEPVRRDSIRVVGVQPPPVMIVEALETLDLPPSGPRDVASPLGPPPSPAVDIPPPATAAHPAVVSAETVSPPAPAIAPSPPESVPSPPHPASPRLVRVAFTAVESFHFMVLHAQQLMRHKYPDGSLEGIFGDALRLLIEKKDLGVRAAAAAARRTRRKNTGGSAAIPPRKD